MRLRTTGPGTLHRICQALGPGLITGAADDDPSGIATYSQAGAQFGYALAWTMLLTLPFMVAILIISACIGGQTGRGLARNIGRELPAPVLYALVLLLVIANTINIAADLAAMGEATIMAAMMVLVSSTRTKLTLALPRWVTLLGWAATGLMALTVGLLTWSSWP